jgi:DNA polymerase-3 subunit gamma/tau
VSHAGGVGVAARADEATGGDTAAGERTAAAGGRTAATGNAGDRGGQGAALRTTATGDEPATSTNGPAAPPQPVPQAPAVVAASAEVEGGPPVTAVAVIEPDGTVGEPEVRVGVELDLGGVAEVWPAVLANVQDRSPMLHALMENARPSGLAGGELTLSWAESAAFSKRKAEEPACREQIAEAIRAVTGSSLRLAYALSDDAGPAAPGPPTLSEDELIERFMREFDAEELPADQEP